MQVRPSVQDLGLGFRILTGVRDSNNKNFSIIRTLIRVTITTMMLIILIIIEAMLLTILIRI